MKNKIKLLFLTLFAFSSITMMAQTYSSTAIYIDPGYPLYQKGFYIGASGGYLFKNKSIESNPLYHLGNGAFAEINGGWRRKAFGWELALGMLTIKRNLPTAAGFSLTSREVLEGMTNKNIFKNALDSNQMQNDQFHFPETIQKINSKQDFKGYYALTGPKLWLGMGQVQLSLHLQGGVAMRRFGYYYTQGSGASSDKFTYSYNSEGVKGTAGKATITASGDYTSYGMTKAYATTLTESTNKDPESNKEKSAVQFLARGGINLNYFFSPKFSISAGADYWYIPSPEMEAGESTIGSVTGSLDPYGSVRKPLPFSDKFSVNNSSQGKKNLGMLSASLGFNVWFGGKNKVVEEPVYNPPPIEQPVDKYKSLMVTVIDKPTGKPLGGVTVKIMKQGGAAYVETLTSEKGMIALQKELTAGVYKITGAKNDIVTTEAVVTAEDFTTTSNIIYRELIHNDLRFSLAGKTINKQTQTALPFIQTSLTNEDLGVALQKSSDSAAHFTYQLEQNTDYNVLAQNKGYFSNKEKVSTKGLDRSKVIYVNLELEVMELKEGASIVLKDIFYDYNKFNIRPDAALVLDNLVKTLEDNPEIKIELSSYTDSRGGDEFNRILSQKRAESAVRYLINKGIARDRLKAKGYGESRLVNDCGNDANCSEEQHQANRRTEIEVLK